MSAISWSLVPAVNVASRLIAGYLNCLGCVAIVASLGLGHVPSVSDFAIRYCSAEVADTNSPSVVELVCLFRVVYAIRKLDCIIRARTQQVSQPSLMLVGKAGDHLREEPLGAPF